jgi:antagonist of KipI
MNNSAQPISGGNSIRVIHPGALTLIQDSGRVGFQQLGVSVSGAVDIASFEIGNRLVGNKSDAASLEVMLGGLVVEFAESSIFAITGAELDADIDGVQVSTGVSYTAHAGARLSLGMVSIGLRAYVAIAGGIATQEVLGSRSSHLASKTGGMDGRQLAVNDVLSIGSRSPESRSGLESFGDSNVLPASEIEIRVILGPQNDEFSDLGLRTLLNSTYSVTDQSNRQGLRLDGPEIESKTGRYDIVSDAVVSGAIQIPGDGKPIILLADRQTTGGYAKIATVASVDLPVLGQTPPGTSVTFTAISVEQAQDLLIERADQNTRDNLSEIIDSMSVQVDGNPVTVGVAENATARIAEINGSIYPILVEEYTPAD